MKCIHADIECTINGACKAIPGAETLCPDLVTFRKSKKVKESIKTKKK